MAESFGFDAERYDRARPRYPRAVIEHILNGIPGRRLLDVGTGTGIVARQFQTAGCQVLGVDPDERMAEFARQTGIAVEVATFEEWRAAERKSDVVVSGQSWHWVDPVAGAAKAAELLRPGGRLALFWNTGQPPASLGRAFAAVYQRVLPASLADRLGPQAIEDAYETICTKAEDGIRQTGAFSEPERAQFEWQHPYTRDEWLDALSTSGDAVAPAQLAGLLAGIGAAIDVVGGRFSMNYVTVVVTATRIGSGAQ